MNTCLSQPTRDDLVKAERALRRLADELNADLRRVLVDVALMTAAEAFEQRRRLDPIAPAEWSAPEWREFFKANLRKSLPGRDLSQVGSAPAQPSSGQHDGVARGMAGTQSRIDGQNGGTRLLNRRREPSPPFKARGSSRDRDAGTWPEIPMRPPAKFARRLSAGVRWRREALSLYLMATEGWSTRQEVLREVGRLAKISPRSGSLVRAFDGLIVNGFLKGQILHMSLSRPTKLAVARLDEDGFDLCRLLGWDAVESEWEKLIRFHDGSNQPEHTAGVLTFVYHARLRGWETEVLPMDAGQGSGPDVRLERNGERVYVEVEFKGGKPAKWRNLEELQGFVAVCAPTAEKRFQMASECALVGLPGIATDLETLIRGTGIASPLWAEEW